MLARFAPLLLSFVASALAQGEQPTPLSGVTVTAPSRFTALSGVTVQTFKDMRPCRQPMDGRWPSDLFDQGARARARRAGPSPGTEDYLRKDLAAIGMGTRNYAQMTFVIARNGERQLPVLEQRFACLGKLRSVSFLHVSDANFDDYEIDFDNGALEATIAPLDELNRSRAQYLRFYEPQPLTRELGALIASLQKDRPDRRAVAPSLAPELEERWPFLHEKFAGWGRVESIDFVRQTSTGAYIYLVTLGPSGRSRSGEVLDTAWAVTAEPGGGQLASLTYAIFSGHEGEPADAPR
jgi:hypothetical protein